MFLLTLIQNCYKDRKLHIPFWIAMLISNFKSGLLVALSTVFISGYQAQSYNDLEAEGISCPARDSCRGYRNNLTYMGRNCECDHNCTAYKDCCIDALPKRNSRPRPNPRPAARTDVTCLNYGEHNHAGVYVINKCSSNWNGPMTIRERCVGAVDFSDPLSSAPATDVAQNKTYRNLACAECSNADLASLINFQIKLACEGLQELSQDQIAADVTYSEEYGLWGLNRLNRFGNGTEFVGCNVIYDVPEYLNNSVRFCRSNLISNCAADWGRPAVARQCQQYMAVVYSNHHAYRNPHCAICNNKIVDELSCDTGISGRKRPMSFALFLDVNQSDGDQVGMTLVATPECPSGQKYDPFFKKCRQLVCALPGYNVVDGKCVKD